MIDFRYHVVSIVAVFLALAVGIVLGTTALNGPILSDLHHNVNDLRKEKRGLESQVRALQGRIDSDTAFASAVEPQIIANRLPHARIVLISAPHASGGVRDAVKKDLVLAGATVTAQVQLASAFTDTSQTALLGDLADRLTPIGFSAPSGSAEQRAATLLAVTLTGGTSTTDFTTVLQGLASGGVLNIQQPAAAGSYVVIIGGNTTPTPPSLTALVAALGAHAKAVVVAGAGNTDNDPLVFDVRKHNSTKVSTVDDADSPVGRASVVLALAAAGDGRRGDFGVGPGASAPLPTPSPHP